MSATATTPPLTTPVEPAVTRGRVTQLRVIRSEWTKLWSLRSTRWTLLVAIVGMAGLGPLVAGVHAVPAVHLDRGDRLHFNAINTGLGGWHFAQLAIGVLEVHGLTGLQIGEIALAEQIVLAELTPLQLSLEQAFMRLTGETVEFHTGSVEEAETDPSTIGVAA